MLQCGQDVRCLFDRLDSTRPSSLGDTPVIGGFAKIQQEVVILAQVSRQQLGLDQVSMKGCPNGSVLREARPRVAKTAVTP